MGKNICIILPVLIFLSCTNQPRPMAEPEVEPVDWKLIWQEEFDYTGLPDSEIWSFQTNGNAWGWGNGEDQFYTEGRRENAWVDENTLKITARRENYVENFNYTSARISTRNKADFLYGRIEVRAKLPVGQGIWPAIWMMPSEDYYGSWPDSGEIDIMEYFGHLPGVVHFNTHTELYNHKIGTNKGARFSDDTLHDQFHIYAVEWLPHRLDFYFDNIKVFTFQRESSDSAVWPFDHPFYILLNCAVGGDWQRANGGIDDSIFPQVFEVDYVRVYEGIYAGDHSLVTSSTAGGSITIQPEQEDYSMAQQVELQAVPDQGFRFISWSGDHFGENNQVTITMGRSKEIRASFQPENELIQNGSFEQNLSHWMFWADPSEAKAEITVDQQQCRVDIDKKAQYPWQIQLNYPLSLEDDVNFTLSFRAKAASERSINLAMVQNHDPYKSFWAQEIQLNDQWESYDFAIQINPGDPNLRLEFDMGNHRADVFIDDVSLIINE